MKSLKQICDTVETLPVTEFYKVLPSLQIMGHTIALIDTRSSREKRYLKAVDGDQAGWQGFIVSDHLKALFSITGSMVSSSGYSDGYDKDISDRVEAATKAAQRAIETYSEGLKNIAKKGAGGSIRYMPAMITISNFGWDISGNNPIVVA